MTKTLKELFVDWPTDVTLRYASYEKGTPKEGEHEFEAEPKHVSFSIGFCEKGFGFGEITFQQTPKGLFLDTEHMDPERVKKYLCMLVDKAIKDTDMDPEKHALFCSEWRRFCGPHCTACYPEHTCLAPDSCTGDCEGCQTKAKAFAAMES